MSTYKPGDVVLAPVLPGSSWERKIRPAVVIAVDGGDLVVCPVSSSPSKDQPSRKLELYDFSSGGLEITGESYILLTCHCRIRVRDVIGLKGRLLPEFLQDLKAGFMAEGSGSDRKSRV
jgi:mRNA interferase MazF